MFVCQISQHNNRVFVSHYIYHAIYHPYLVTKPFLSHPRHAPATLTMHCHVKWKRHSTTTAHDFFARSQFRQYSKAANWQRSSALKEKCRGFGNSFKQYFYL